MNTRILTPYLSGFGATIAPRNSSEDILEILLRPRSSPDELMIPIPTKYGIISTTASNLIEAVKLPMGDELLNAVPYSMIESIAQAAGRNLPASSVIMVRQKIAEGKGSISYNSEQSPSTDRQLIDLTKMQVAIKNGVATFVEPEVVPPNQSADETPTLTASTPKSSKRFLLLGLVSLVIIGGGIWYSKNRKKKKSKD